MDLRISAKEVKQKVRIVRYHDIQTCRDIVVGIDRFFEATYKRGGSSLGTIDLTRISHTAATILEQVPSDESI